MTAMTAPDARLALELADDIKRLRKFTYDGNGGNQARQAIDRIEAALRASQPGTDWSQQQADIIACMRECWGLITDGMAREDFFAAAAVCIQGRLRTPRKDQK